MIDYKGFNDSCRLRPAGFVADTKYRPRTEITMAPAGERSQGASASTPACAASCSITPQLGVGSANPKPTNDRVASARMNAGKSKVAWTTRYPRAAGRRWSSRILSGEAPRALAASAYSLPRSAATTARTPRAGYGHPATLNIPAIVQNTWGVVRTSGIAARRTITI